MGQTRAMQDTTALLATRQKVNSPHQFSHTALGSTPLITRQCPMALSLCHFSSSLVLPTRNTSPSSSKLAFERSISCCGSRNALRAPLPRKSASLGLRKVMRAFGVFLQKRTMLVKSGPRVFLAAEAVAGSSSRKMRHEGKTAKMVRRIWDAAGRVRSPA